MSDANTSLMTSSCWTAVSTYIGSMRETSPSNFSNSGGTSLRIEAKGQLCSEGTLECGGR